MSMFVRLMKSPLVNPNTMTEKIKLVWCGIGCMSTSVITLTYIMSDATRQAKKRMN